GEPVSRHGRRQLYPAQPRLPRRRWPPRDDRGARRRASRDRHGAADCATADDYRLDAAGPAKRLQGAARRRGFADGVAVRRGRPAAPRDGPDLSARRSRGGACPHGSRRTCRQDRSGGQAMTREELYAQAEAYLDALEARDPSRLAWADGARFSENNVALAIGDGLWNTISARRRTYDLKA